MCNLSKTGVKKELDKLDGNCLYQTSCRESTIMDVPSISCPVFSLHVHVDGDGKRRVFTDSRKATKSLATTQQLASRAGIVNVFDR